MSNIYYQFIAAWVLALFAILLGRYVGRNPPKFPDSVVSTVSIIFAVWVAAFVCKIAFSYAGKALQLSEAAQQGYAETVLPIIFAAVVTRRLLAACRKDAVS